MRFLVDTETLEVLSEENGQEIGRISSCSAEERLHMADDTIFRASLMRSYRLELHVKAV